MGRLDGKVALISGGARGQGAAEARLFAAEGAKVMVGDVLDEDGEALARELTSDRGAYRHHDVTDEGQWSGIVTEALERFGQLDILVNNAGIFRILPMMQTSLDDYRQINDVNQIGVFLGMKAATPALIERGGGSIVNISSIAGTARFGRIVRLLLQQVGGAGDDEVRGARARGVQGAGQLDPPGHHRHADGTGVREVRRARGSA